MTFGLSAGTIATIATTAVGVGSAALSAKQRRKAQRRAEEAAQQAALIEGAAPAIGRVSEVIPEEIQGSDVTGLAAALDAMDYEGGQPPIPGQDDAMGAIPTDLSEEELIELIESGGLGGLLPQMADGGPVGTPNDVYYFGVPQIMGMMQDPDPQIQQVGMQLAGQMETMPDAGMVPATMDQIRTMAYGGAVEPKKFEMGGSTTKRDLKRLQDLIEESGRTKLLNRLGLPEDFGQRDTEDVLFSELIDRLDLPVDIQKEGDEYSMSKIFGDEDSSLRLGASTNRGDPQVRLDFQKRFANGGPTEYNPELDLDFILQQEALEELLELDELVEKGIISEARAEYDRQRLSGRAFPQESEPGRILTDRDRKNIKEMSRKRKAYGGAISEERLNNARLR